MAPETITAIGVVAGALVSTGPAYWALRRARGAEQSAQNEGRATREAVGTATELVVARLAERIDVTRADLRDDVAELRAEIQGVRDWQTSHTAEHVLLTRRR